MTKNEFGVFEVVVPGKDGKPTIPHDSKIKVCFLNASYGHRLTFDIGLFRRPQ
jgi:1,4-alpha-glucan branching enzyme